MRFLALIVLLLPSLACAQSVLGTGGQVRQLIVTDHALTTDAEMVLLRNASAAMRVQAGVTATDDGILALRNNAAASANVSLSSEITPDMLIMRNAALGARVRLGIGIDDGQMDLLGADNQSGVSLRSDANSAMVTLHAATSGAVRLSAGITPLSHGILTLTNNSAAAANVSLSAEVTDSMLMLRNAALGARFQAGATADIGLLRIGAADNDLFTLTVPVNLVKSWTLTVPDDDPPGAGYFLSFDTNGVASWSLGGGGGDVFTTAANVFTTGPQTIRVSTTAEALWKIDVEHAAASANAQFSGAVYSGAFSGVGVRFRGHAYRGTRASPDFLASGDVITSLDATVWDGASALHNAGALQMVAAEAHTGSTLGTRYNWFLHPLGGTSNVLAMTLHAPTSSQAELELGAAGTRQARIIFNNSVASAFAGLIGSNTSTQGDITFFGSGGVGAAFRPSADASDNMGLATVRWDNGYFVNTRSNTLRLVTTAGGTEIIQAKPASLVKTWTLTWPNDDPPGANYILEADTNGTLSWIATPSGGSFTCNDAGNCVNLNGTQTITGAKTFRSNLTVQTSGGSTRLSGGDLVSPTGGIWRVHDAGGTSRAEMSATSSIGAFEAYNSSGTKEINIAARAAFALGDSLDITNTSGTFKVRAGVVDSGNSGSLITAGTNDAAIRGANTTALVGLYVNSTRVVGVQQAAVSDCTDTGNNTCQRLNDLLARVRTHGLIAP